MIIKWDPFYLKDWNLCIVNRLCGNHELGIKYEK